MFVDAVKKPLYEVKSRVERILKVYITIGKKSIQFNIKSILKLYVLHY